MIQFDISCDKTSSFTTKLMILQAECVNPTNVRRSSVTSLPSRKSSSASSTQLGGGGDHTRMSRHDEHKMDQKAKQEDKVDPDMIPCEFCGDMQYEETIMRHQVHHANQRFNIICHLGANTFRGRIGITGRIVSAQKISLDFRPKFRPVFHRTEFEDKMV